MGRLHKGACCGLLFLLLAPGALQAAKLRVKSDPSNPPTNRPTGYFLLGQAEQTGLPANQLQRWRKISNNRFWGPHAISDAPILPPGTYYIYPECENRLKLRFIRISENEGEVRLLCQ